MSQEIAIIGSGFSSLSAACYLAQAGNKVTVYEKNNTIGGRARQMKKEGFTFDMGPSWYWMPDVFERFFNDFGKKTVDYYDLIKLSPAYRVYYGINDFVSISIGAKIIKSNSAFSETKIFKLADNALYEAKELGRNKAVIKE